VKNWTENIIWLQLTYSTHPPSPVHLLRKFQDEKRKKINTVFILFTGGHIKQLLLCPCFSNTKKGSKISVHFGHSGNYVHNSYLYRNGYVYTLYFSTHIHICHVWWPSRLQMNGYFLCTFLLFPYHHHHHHHPLISFLQTYNIWLSIMWCGGGGTGYFVFQNFRWTWTRKTGRVSEWWVVWWCDG